jgi:hypothetical protein
MADRTEGGRNGLKLARFLHWAKNLVAAILGHRRTTITIETEQFLIIRRRDGTHRWRPEYGGGTDTIKPVKASIMTGLTQTRQRDLATTAKWRVAEAADGSLLTCLDCLLGSPQVQSLETEDPFSRRRAGLGNNVGGIGISKRRMVP